MEKTNTALEKCKKFFSNIPLRAYLLYLIVASLVFTGVTFSSYISTSRGVDSTYVALFANDVVMNIPINEDCYPGCSFEVPVTVSNYEIGREENVCQVSQTYELSAEFMVGNLPLSVTWKSGEGVNIQDGKIVGSFGAGDSATLVTYYAIITWPTDADKTSYQYADEIEVLRISAICEQID